MKKTITRVLYSPEWLHDVNSWPRYTVTYRDPSTGKESCRSYYGLLLDLPKTVQAFIATHELHEYRHGCSWS